jgi:hypothetical protein
MQSSAGGASCAKTGWAVAIATANKVLPTIKVDLRIGVSAVGPSRRGHIHIAFNRNLLRGASGEAHLFHADAILCRSCCNNATK